MINVLPTIAIDSDPADVPQPGAGQVFVFFTQDGTLNAKLPTNVTVQLVGTQAGQPGSEVFTLPVGFPPGGLITADNVGNTLTLAPSTVNSVLCIAAPGVLGWRDLAQAIDQLGIGEAPADGQEYCRQNKAWVVGGGGGFADVPDDQQLYVRAFETWTLLPSYVPLGGYNFGDLLYAGPDGKMAVLPKGAAGEVLTCNGDGTLSWVALPAGTGTGTGTGGSGGGGGGGGGAAVLPGTAIGSPAYSSDYAIANAMDGDPATAYAGADASGAWIGVDLGAVCTVSQVQIYPRAGYEGALAGVSIDTSADGVTWTPTGSMTPASIVGGAYRAANLSPAVQTRYLRMVGNDGSRATVADLRFLGTP